MKSTTPNIRWQNPTTIMFSIFSDFQCKCLYSTIVRKKLPIDHSFSQLQKASKRKIMSLPTVMANQQPYQNISQTKHERIMKEYGINCG